MLAARDAPGFAAAGSTFPALQSLLHAPRSGIPDPLFAIHAPRFRLFALIPCRSLGGAASRSPSWPRRCGPEPSFPSPSLPCGVSGVLQTRLSPRKAEQPSPVLLTCSDRPASLHGSGPGAGYWPQMFYVLARPRAAALLDPGEETRLTCGVFSSASARWLCRLLTLWSLPSAHH